jgi:hypothetical protein
MVKGAASPDDPTLADYWAKRRKKVKPPLDRYTLRLLAKQAGRLELGVDAERLRQLLEGTLPESEKGFRLQPLGES